ncbi:hypothetical protein [Sulfuricurvum sp.]|uniref:hypothetical protein n=1 Tax=Sulfuricurvum sp. TaxID=2025608 RepID=UPI003C47AA3C
MNILLFNDNPVVRKLVALSAQKTKDDLSVIWSVDEIQESGFDLLIIDDALYSDELFESIKELVTFKSTLLMATRGKAVPAGFENVINKPFLPTDLVDMFIQIEKKISSIPPATQSMKSEENFTEAPLYAINLDETLTKTESFGDEFDSFDLGDLDEEFDLDDELDEIIPGSKAGNDDFDSFELGDLNLDDEEDEEILPTAILDQEEVQEVQNLLDDTESDDWNVEDDIMIKGIDELDELDELDLPKEESGDFGSLDDELLLEEDDFGDLELQIQDAVSGLDTEALDKELELDDFELDFDDALMEKLDLSDKEIVDSEDMEGFDEFDMLDERELKLAIGEEVEEEPVAGIDEEDLFLETEELDEEMKDTDLNEEVAQVASSTVSTAHTEGVEALQALLKALSNEDVAKSLKGLNISININFGNDA